MDWHQLGFHTERKRVLVICFYFQKHSKSENNLNLRVVMNERPSFAINIYSKHNPSRFLLVLGNVGLREGNILKYSKSEGTCTHAWEVGSYHLYICSTNSIFNFLLWNWQNIEGVDNSGINLSMSIYLYIYNKGRESNIRRELQIGFFPICTWTSL